MFGATFGALDLPASVVDETVETWLLAIGVVTWQEFWVSIPVQADSAREQLFQLAPGGRHLSCDEFRVLAKSGLKDAWVSVHSQMVYSRI